MEQEQAEIPPDAPVSGELKGCPTPGRPSSAPTPWLQNKGADLSPDEKQVLHHQWYQKMWISNAQRHVVYRIAQVDGDKFTGFVSNAIVRAGTGRREGNKLGIKGVFYPPGVLRKREGSGEGECTGRDR